MLLVGHALVRGRDAERGFEGHAGADIVAERLLRKAHDRPERRRLTRLPRQERRVSEPQQRLLADRHHLLVLPVLVERQASLDQQRINPERRARPEAAQRLGRGGRWRRRGRGRDGRWGCDRRGWNARGKRLARGDVFGVPSVRARVGRDLAAAHPRPRPRLNRGRHFGRRRGRGPCDNRDVHLGQSRGRGLPRDRRRRLRGLSAPNGVARPGRPDELEDAEHQQGARPDDRDEDQRLFAQHGTSTGRRSAIERYAARTTARSRRPSAPSVSGVLPIRIASSNALSMAT